MSLMSLLDPKTVPTVEHPRFLRAQRPQSMRRSSIAERDLNGEEHPT
jgi:hypothetical protein